MRDPVNVGIAGEHRGLCRRLLAVEPHQEHGVPALADVGTIVVAEALPLDKNEAGVSDWEGKMRQEKMIIFVVIGIAEVDRDIIDVGVDP